MTHLHGSGGAPLVPPGQPCLLDLDGTVYVGGKAVPRAVHAVEMLQAQRSPCLYLTNNASRTPEATAAHLTSLGLPASPEDVVTSAQAAAALLASELPPGAAVLVVGGEGLLRALEAEGLRPVSCATDEPAAVAQGFAPDVGWRLLAEGTFAVRRGVPYVATNLDATIPVEGGLAPGNGALVDVVARTAGVRPRVAGKPQAAVARVALDRLGAASGVVVGDRLDTDIACANAAGLPSLLVLTGVHGVGDVVAATGALRPTHLGLDLSAVQEEHPPVVTADGGFRCRSWLATLEEAGGPDGTPVRRLRLGRAGSAGAQVLAAEDVTADDVQDALRVLVAAAWSVTDAAGPGRLDADEAVAAVGAAVSRVLSVRASTSA